jgi:hypothetical protein
MFYHYQLSTRVIFLAAAIPPESDFSDGIFVSFAPKALGF